MMFLGNLAEEKIYQVVFLLIQEYFSYYGGLIEAGEAGGILSKVLERLALLLEAQSKIKGQITGALIYPVAVLVLAVTISLAC